MINVRYLGKKDWEVDVWAGTGIIWNGQGDIKPMPDDKAKHLVEMLPSEFAYDGDNGKYEGMERDDLRALYFQRVGSHAPGKMSNDRIIDKLLELDDTDPEVIEPTEPEVIETPEPEVISESESAEA